MADYRPPVPAYDRSVVLETFEDACAHVADVFDIDNQKERALRLVRRAVIEAYRDLPTHHRWQYFERRGQVVTVAEQTTGTVVYDHTGGTYERQLTLTGATWPTDIQFYNIDIDNTQYKIEAYKSSTVITLTQDSNPGADVASTTYTAFRSQYPLPVGCRRMSNPVELSDFWGMEYIAPEGWLRRLVSYTDPSEPLFYTIRDSGEHYGGLVIEFAPPPDSSRVYDFMYEASPRPVQMWGGDEAYTTGTVSVSSTTVTGSGTAWTSAMVGSVIRFSTTSAVPTNMFGKYPYAEQRIVTAVGSATSLTIDSALTGSYSGKAYSIGDPLDVEMTAMLTYLHRLSEAKYARMARHDDLDEFEAMSRHALAAAKIADNRDRDLAKTSLSPTWLVATATPE